MINRIHRTRQLELYTFKHNVVNVEQPNSAIVIYFEDYSSLRVCLLRNEVLHGIVYVAKRLLMR